MAVQAGDLEAELIDALADRVREALPALPSASLTEFVRQYYHWVPHADLAGREPADLAGAVIAHLRSVTERHRHEARVAVYNPERESDGWASPFTVVEIVSDDMPFLVDSVTMELSRQGLAIELVIHPVMRVVRDEEGRLQEVLEHGGEAPGMVIESVMHVEVTRQVDSDRLSVLRAGVETVLEEVRAAVEDWAPMRERAFELADELDREPPPLARHEVAEAARFLRWLAEDHFTFLGYREYELHEEELRMVAGSGLGVLRGSSSEPVKRLDPRALQLAHLPHPLVLTKANSRATVHRPAYLDYIGVKRIAPDGTVLGERRFLGLYTTRAYKRRPQEIPILRDKVQRVLDRAAFPPDSHDAKGINDILESLPREVLVRITISDLVHLAIGMLGLGERQRVRLFISKDQLDRFVTCFLLLPRDRFNTENRRRAAEILAEAFGGGEVEWRPNLGESVVVRIDYVVHCDHGIPADYDVPAIEARIAHATRAWSDELRAALIEAHGEREGLVLHGRFRSAFPPTYQADWSPGEAVGDIDRLVRLRARELPIISIYRRSEHGVDRMRLKLLSSAPILLSDVLPTFEDLGAKVIDERPYEVSPPEEEPAWIYDFGLACPVAELEASADAFAEVFLGVWAGRYEDDALGGLVLAAGATGREIALIRAVARYLRQAQVAFSDAYMQRTLLAHPDIAAGLVRFFCARFDPDAADPDGGEGRAEELERAIDAVESLDEDRILRSFMAVLRAMLRTNFFRRDADGRPPAHLSFKLDPTRLSLLPRPRPRFEIFVYSPRVEGVHLRGGKVARGGLRWSDRREDFRTEVLGLMKAQMVKNALIVPVGSKGGFVVKRPPEGGGREALVAEAIECYRTFLRGLLDLTDNYRGEEVVGPERVVRYDDEDPYLVVAADKGTATFSDIANEVSAEYGFWLGDAFASGGSHGYDHKAMGITARGAWESVKRHFSELGVDVSSQELSVVGIGDMSGDVFGNGMLLSPHIRLLAAFNHLHVFLDPDPDPAASFAERKRLFELPRSSWDDYDRELISEGGGVFPRTLKSIPVAPQVRSALGIETSALSPAELIRALLAAPVDLLFNGGIGTYVKASHETHADAGDKANDALRVDGARLRCRVVGEGGNLGLTQAGRVEYALQGGPDGEGGRINTDAIDNVAGVNCSDHEVNIKILLDGLVAGGEMTVPERNDLLAEMTEAVAKRVLYDSYAQTQAMSIAVRQAPALSGVHARMLRALERDAGLDRELERLPRERAITERRAGGRGLVSPELAIVMAHAKIGLFERLLESSLPDDPYLVGDLERYFPEPLGPGPGRGDAAGPAERFATRMRSHRLRREIVATLVANQLVERAGSTFAFRIGEETGAGEPQLARAYLVTREVFEMRAYWSEVEGLDHRIESGVGLDMLVHGQRLVERASRWLVRNAVEDIDIQGSIDRYLPGARMLAHALPGVLHGIDRETFESRQAGLREAGVPLTLARRVASLQALLSSFDVVEEAMATGLPQPVVAATYFTLGSRLGLDWLRDRILELPRADRWQALARASLRDELYRLHRWLTRDVLEDSNGALPAGGWGPDGADQAIAAWLQSHRPGIDRAAGVLDDVKASRTYDTTTLPVVLRELKNLLPRDALS